MIRSAAFPLLSVLVIVSAAAIGWPLSALQWGALVPGVALLAIINWAFIVSPSAKS